MSHEPPKLIGVISPLKAREELTLRKPSSVVRLPKLVPSPVSCFEQ